MCPHCYGSELEWVAPSGRGTVYSFSQVAGRNGDGPVVLLVDLDEGVRIMGGAPAECAHELRIGSRVKGALIAGDGGGRIVFELERQ
jgi:uncharacterized OB-fold protein